MEKQAISTVIEYLDKIGAKLGVGLDYLWPIFVRQQYVEAFWALLVWLGFITIFVLSARFAYKQRNLKSIDQDISCILLVISIIFSIVLFACCIITGTSFIIEFPDIFNPEYAAFKSLINLM